MQLFLSVQVLLLLLIALLLMLMLMFTFSCSVHVHFHCGWPSWISSAILGGNISLVIKLNLPCLIKP